MNAFKAYFHTMDFFDYNVHRGCRGEDIYQLIDGDLNFEHQGRLLLSQEELSFVLSESFNMQ